MKEDVSHMHYVPTNQLHPNIGGQFVNHPGGLSGLFFNFATSVIHSVFRTSRVDVNINQTSSYVFGPVYLDSLDDYLMRVLL